MTVLTCHFAVAFWISQDISAGLARRRPLYPGSTGAPGFARVLDSLPVDLAALGVSLFFLLSGFVIAISLERYSRRGFLVGRLMRVLPTYAAGYLVTCGVIWLMSDPNHELSPRSVLFGAVPGLALLARVSAPGDGIVWTLIVELVFYAVCLVTYRALTRHWQAIVAVAAGCVAMQWLLGSVALDPHLAGLAYVVALACPFIPVMLVGVTLSARRRERLSGRATAIVVPLLAATTTLAPASVTYRVTFVVAMTAFAMIAAVGDRWRQHPVASFFADISYPLYVVHPVLGYATISLLTGHGVPSALAVLAASVVALVAAWCLHVLVEAPTHTLGRRWAGRFPASIPVTVPVHADA